VSRRPSEPSPCCFANLVPDTSSRHTPFQLYHCLHIFALRSVIRYVCRLHFPIHQRGGTDEAGLSHDHTKHTDDR
jgi:hypothetical protein